MEPQTPPTNRAGTRSRNIPSWYRAASAFVAIVLLIMAIMESGSPLGLVARLVLAFFFGAEALGYRISVILDSWLTG